MKIKNIKIKFTKLLTVLLTLCMILSIVPITAYSAETEVSGEKPLTNNYTHTYHTNIKVTADVKIIDQSGNLISTTVINKESPAIPLLRRPVTTTVLLCGLPFCSSAAVFLLCFALQTRRKK